ncbi:MAG: hypothetical protein AB7S65_01755 [Sulfuricurvum sp.]
MTLKYAGPKPLISAHGIEFDHNKEDKFIYLNFVVELIRALDHEYIEERRYVHNTSGLVIDPAAMVRSIASYDPNLENEVAQRVQITQELIEDELRRAHENKVLCCDEERDVLIKNIQILRDYRIQRAINKTVYYSGIHTLAKIIHKGHISYVTAPMLPIYFHVFHSIQGALNKLHPPTPSKIEIFGESGHLFTRLEIQEG